jgi:hypothetical protein
MTDEARSEEACPACGAHRLALLRFADDAPVDDQAPQALLGATLAQADEPPAIGCLACGTEWPDLATFRRAQEKGTAGPP